MNRKARRMNRQLKAGKPTTGRLGCLPFVALGVAGLATSTLFAFLATWLA